MTDRCQLNLRLDGRRDLLESCKEVATAQGLSLNAWVIKQLELAISHNCQMPTVNTTRQALDTEAVTTRQALDTEAVTTRQALDTEAVTTRQALDNQKASEVLGKLQA